MANFVPADEFDLVIFGGTGDLALRKLLPALYHRVGDGQITGDSRIIAASRREVALDDYLQTVEQALRGNLPAGEFREEQWADFKGPVEALALRMWSTRASITAGSAALPRGAAFEELPDPGGQRFLPRLLQQRSKGLRQAVLRSRPRAS